MKRNNNERARRTRQNVPYDAGYRSLFANVRLIQELLESFVHEAWVKELDFSKASLVNTTVVLPAYRTY